MYKALIRMYNVQGSYIQGYYTYVHTRLLYVQCSYMYNALICTMLLYIQGSYMYNAPICTMLLYVQCSYIYKALIKALTW